MPQIEANVWFSPKPGKKVQPLEIHNFKEQLGEIELHGCTRSRTTACRKLTTAINSSMVQPTGRHIPKPSWQKQLPMGQEDRPSSSSSTVDEAALSPLDRLARKFEALQEVKPEIGKPTLPPRPRRKRKRDQSELEASIPKAPGKRRKKSKKKTSKAKDAKTSKPAQNNDPFINLWIAGKEDEATEPILQRFLQENGDPSGPGQSVYEWPLSKLRKMAKQRASEIVKDRTLKQPESEYWQGGHDEILEAFHQLKTGGATCKTIAIMCNRPYEKIKANIRWLRDKGLLNLSDHKVVSKRPLKRAAYLHYFELPQAAKITPINLPPPTPTNLPPPIVVVPGEPILNVGCHREGQDEQVVVGQLPRAPIDAGGFSRLHQISLGGFSTLGDIHKLAQSFPSDGNFGGF